MADKEIGMDSSELLFCKSTFKTHCCTKRENSISDIMLWFPVSMEFLNFTGTKKGISEHHPQSST